jgi:LuxR family maltose regulon positive regulatory protein
MSAPVVATKLFIPPPRPDTILRPRLVERLNQGLRSKLTLISAAAGSGKTTLVSSWVRGLQAEARSEGRAARRVAWLSLDKDDNDPARFLIHLVAALQTVSPDLGAPALAALQLPQPPPADAILTALLNELAGGAGSYTLVLDDYHVIEVEPVDRALAFLVEHLPPQLHLLIATREDPQLPLPRLRARGHLTELRAADLRFTLVEAAAFLNHSMGLNLSAEAVAMLEFRTEGWVAGLQLAALSLQGQQDAASFITTFSGSHHFVLDYLIEEVLHQQSEHVQRFLLRTSILGRLCAPLCGALLGSSASSAQATLDYLEQANLFIVPLDNQRRWFRYHHLFAELLRQRLQQQSITSPDDEEVRAAELHLRASVWFEANGLEFEAFQHAAAANDIERAERLIEGQGLPLHLRGAMAAIIAWLASLPRAVLDARPSLWVRYAALLLVTGQTTGVDAKLDAAEEALQGAEPDERTRNLIGQIATARATLALTRYQLQPMLDQSRRALEYLHPGNQTDRVSAMWSQAFAYYLQGDRAASGRVFREALAISQASGLTFSTILTATGLGQLQELDTQLYQASETYRYVLRLAGEQPLQIVYEAHLGLARVLYEWYELDAAEEHGRQSLELARQYDSVIDRSVLCELFLARVKLARGDVASAAAQLAQVGQFARQRNFVHRLAEIAAAQVVTLLRQGNLTAAAHLAQAHDLPLSQARVLLAKGEHTAALALLEPVRRQAETRGWQDERLRAMALQLVALQSSGAAEAAVRLLGDVLALAEPGGFIRLFVDEGALMRQALQAASARGLAPDYTQRLLAAFSAGGVRRAAQLADVTALSERELEVLQQIAEGRTDRMIAERLFLSLHTVKVHARNIYSKLGVSNRTHAVARARELGLLPHS